MSFFAISVKTLQKTTFKGVQNFSHDPREGLWPVKVKKDLAKKKWRYIFIGNPSM